MAFVSRFEKSLYDLIWGMRNHKGNEREYIQNCLKECRAEIRSQDLDLKATAMLKLVYLEMFGHDMSWASFHVLEVMASPKYHQKRVGYLGAVQSFRPDTEVLMLATNLLKKDLTGASTTTIALPIVALPHLITPSLALSTLSDLLPRLSHSNPTVRKKTIALVFPETLRAAWPKIKEKLMDTKEDPSVTAAIVNVVCELGWRRPNDFLPLAPRLFELLVDSGNNWMAIKLIKLFATLTPLEPRLVRKLLPPLTEIIRSTPAMSLLYECINGIIQGGILGSGDDDDGREEIASLCIVVTHPWLVAQQEDVILECIDSTDISIRIKSLDLVQGMVSSENLISIVGRLMRQLKSASPENGRNAAVDPADLDSDEEALEETINPRQQNDGQSQPLPDDYRADVITRILSMCSRNNYSNLTDFEWYIDVLSQLIRMAPLPRPTNDLESSTTSKSNIGDASERIGDELRNVTVKVHAIRPACVEAANAILMQFNKDAPSGHPVTSGAVKPIAWVIGEFAAETVSPDDTLGSLLQLIPRITSPESLAACLQAATKVFSLIAGDSIAPWTPERKSMISLLMARIIHVFEPLAMHPNLEVQERAVEFIELLKLTAEAVSGQDASGEASDYAPLLLTQAMPSLFVGWELKSVAVSAQKNVPFPEGLDLDEPINPNLNSLLANAQPLSMPTEEADEFEIYYNKRPPPTSIVSEPAINRLVESREEVVGSYQQSPSEDAYLDPDILARRKAERRERNKDDPFYIGEGSSLTGTSTPIHNILQNSNGPDLDVDSIPIMELDLDKLNVGISGSVPSQARKSPRPKPPRQKIVIAADENLAGSGGSTPRQYDSENNSDSFTKSRAKQLKQSVLLGVDSTNIGSLNLEAEPDSRGYDYEAQQREEAEMARALKEVERLRLEMQRANDRIQVAQGVDAEGTVVKKKTKKKKAPAAALADGEEGGSGTAVVKAKKKKKKVVVPDAGEGPDNNDDNNDKQTPAPVKEAATEKAEEPAAVKPKKKKKKARAAEIQD
ncbi:adaptin N terminal region-domain-containing protein [Apiospora marii]|uniref:AP-3 complex subunit delta n=1 Tax=Apiospora marii TaxID=335849 RepID=A0ABR1R7T2_9PEZI